MALLPLLFDFPIWFLDLLNYTAICGIMLFLGSGETRRIWRIAEIRGRPGNFYFQSGGRLLYEEEVRQFSFSGREGWTYEGKGVIFLGEVYTLCILWSHIFAWPIVFILLCNFGRYMEKSSNIREKVNFK